MIHPDTPEVRSLDATPETKALVEEMQDVLRCEQAWGVAQKHLNAAFERGKLFAQKPRSKKRNPRSKKRNR